MDLDFFKPFIDGALKTIEVQCGLQAKALKPYYEEPDNEENLRDDLSICGIIGLTSKEFNGSIAISFTKDSFLQIMGSMLGETYTEIDRDLEDGAAELLNIIFGQAKITLNEQGYNVEMAIPNVIRGESIQTHTMTSGKIVILPFQLQQYNSSFYIDICVEDKADSK